MKHSFLKSFQQNKFVSGLTLVEAMVGMLVGFAFLGAASQAFVSATALRVQNRSSKDAIRYAQDDIESIRDLAQSYDSNDPLHSQYCASANGQGYGIRLMNNVEAQLANNAVQSNPGNPSSGQLVQKRAVLTIKAPDGRDEYEVTRTLAVPSDSPTLSKDVLLLAYVVRDLDKSRMMASVGATNPGNQGSNGTNGSQEDVIGKFDTAIIPSAALSCP